MISVLDKHPAPWGVDADTRQLTDERGRVIADGVQPDVAPLILAAPELLAALKVSNLALANLVSETDDKTLGEARKSWYATNALIRRIESQEPETTAIDPNPVCALCGAPAGGGDRYTVDSVLLGGLVGSAMSLIGKTTRPVCKACFKKIEDDELARIKGGK